MPTASAQSPERHAGLNAVMESFTPAIVSLLMLLALGDAAAGFFDVGDLRDEGTACFHLRYGRNGICTYLNDCPTVYSDLERKLIFPQICGFSDGRNLLPNVCCVADVLASPPAHQVPSATITLQPETQSPTDYQHFSPQTQETPFSGQLPNLQIKDGESETLSTNVGDGFYEPMPTTTPMSRETSTHSVVTQPRQPFFQQTAPAVAQRNEQGDEETDPLIFPGQPLASSSPSLLHAEMAPATPEGYEAVTNRPPVSTAAPTATIPMTTTSTPTTRMATTQTTTTSTTTTTTPITISTTTTSIRAIPITATSTTTTPMTTTPTRTSSTSTIPITITPTTTTSAKTTTTRMTSAPTTLTSTTTTPITSSTKIPSQPISPMSSVTRKPVKTTKLDVAKDMQASTTAPELDPLERPTPAAQLLPGATRPPCFTTIPPLPAVPPDSEKTVTAVIKLRETPEGDLSVGDVQDIEDNIIEPAPALPACTADDDCVGWDTMGWTRERRQVSDGYPLSVDEQVRIQIITTRSGQVSIGLCSDRSCGVVRITEVNDSDSAAMKFDTLITTTDDIMDPNSRVVESSGRSDSIPSGRRYTFVAQRRSDRVLDVWLDRQPSNKATVPLEPDMARLRVASSAGALSIRQVAGEEMDGYHMDIEEQVPVRLSVTRDGLLDLGLCGDTSCSVVRVTGVGDTMGYSTRITKSNSVDEERAEVLLPATGPGSFTLNQSYTFVVSRRSEWNMDVWLQNDPANRVTVPLEPDRLRLKVESDAGVTSFGAESASDGFALPLDKQVMVRLRPDRESGWLDLALCGAASCSVIRVQGADPAPGGFGYSTRVTPTNSASDTRGVIAQPEGPNTFTVGAPVTFALRRAPGSLELRRDGDDLQVVNVAVRDDNSVLKLSSTVGSASLTQVVDDGYPMEVGQRLTVSLSVSRPDGWLFVGLCSASSCSSLGIIGVSKDSRISYFTRIINSNSIIGDGSLRQSSTRGAKRFVQGMTYRFIVQRRTRSQLDVWLEVAPSRKVTVPLEDDRSKLKVASDAGDVSILNGGVPVKIGYPMAIGEEVKVQIRATKDTGWTFFGMCGSESCSVVGVGGVGGATATQFDSATKITTSNSLLSPGPVLTESPGPDTFTPNSTYTFRVQRRSPHLMAVWLEGVEQTRVTVPLDSDKHHLQVLSSVGSIKFLQGRAVDGYPMAIDERVLVHFEPVGTPMERPWLSLGLCNEQSCGVVTVTGADGDSRLEFVTRTTTSNSVADKSGAVMQDMRGQRGFIPKRNYTFVLHRHSARSMDVWLRGHPGSKITVPLSPDQTLLKVDSNFASTRVERRGAADGWRMAVGERAWLSLRVDRSLGRLNLGLCGPSQCSVLRISGVDDQPSIGFSTSVSGRGDEMDFQPGPTEFTPGQNHTFVVHRRSAAELDVWLEEDPVNKVTIPLRAGADRLKASSSVGSFAFIRGKRWSSPSPSAALASPVLQGRPGSRACVSVEYLSDTKESPLVLSVVTDRGRTSPAASIPPAQSGSWLHRRVILTLPREPFREWRLLLSAASGVYVRSIGSCYLGSYDVVRVGESVERTREPMLQPGRGSFGRSDDVADTDACYNGGRRNMTRNCICPPGFSGLTCQTGCGPNAYGAVCEKFCSISPQGCSGALLCVSGLECGCAPGFAGRRCDTPCSSGQFGVDCLQACPQCGARGTCDPYTGRCETC